MEVCQSLVCPCNGKLYKSEQSLKSHRKTNIHTLWEKKNGEKDILVKIKQLEIENCQLRRLNILLIEQLNSKLKINTDVEQRCK